MMAKAIIYHAFAADVRIQSRIKGYLLGRRGHRFA
jgi:hypothetical protein